MSRNLVLMERLCNRILVVDPARAQMLLGYLSSRAGLDGALVLPGAGDLQVPFTDLAAQAHASVDGVDAPSRPYALIDGVAVVPIQGTLAHKSGFCDALSGITSYQTIGSMVNQAMADPDVCGILLDVDSPGGEAAGCFDFADALSAAGQEKPIWAVCSEIALSGGYALASQAARLYSPRTGLVGSIGVISLHGDLSGKLAKEGIKVTLVTAGACKGEGNPYEALPEEVRDKWQQGQEYVRGLFVETVARHRSLTAEDALATEAAIYGSEDALTLGLIDGIAPFDDVLGEFIDYLATPRDALSAPATKTSITQTKPQTEMKDENMARRKIRTNRKTKAKAKVEGGAPPPEDDEDDAAVEGEDPSDTSEDEDAAALEGEEEDDEDAAAVEGEDPSDTSEDDEDAALEGEEEDDEDKPKPPPAAARAAVKKSKARISAILNSKAAVGREALAQHLALKTNMSAKSTIASLKAAPKGTAGNQANFAQMMGGNADPGVGGDGGSAPSTATAGLSAAVQSEIKKLPGQKG